MTMPQAIVVRPTRSPLSLVKRIVNAEFGAEAARLQALLLQPAHHHRFFAMGDDHPLRPGGGDGR